MYLLILILRADHYYWALYVLMHHARDFVIHHASTSVLECALVVTFEGEIVATAIWRMKFIIVTAFDRGNVLSALSY